ncbi:MAG: PhoH family protein [Myxococcota bacterium]|jgi:PhoH-like ATPase|nr:PhoH family protein [Myxococcota bacterium]
MKKNFVLDTNVLLHDPNAMFAFADNNVVIPIYVIEEIDNFKKDLSELGRNARQISRLLDELRAGGRLIDGVPIGDTGGNLRVAFTQTELPEEFALSTHAADNRILATALENKLEYPDVPLVFITKDINLRIRASALGIEVRDYLVENTEIDELYSGIFTFVLEPPALQKLFDEGQAPLPPPTNGDTYPPNAFGVADDGNGQGSALVRLHPEAGVIRLLKGKGNPLWGIRPRNKEQRFAVELLLDDRVQLLTLVGRAGTGKTLLALAAGLQRVVEDRAFQRMLVSRPVFPLGRDIGFLPGDVEDKLRPWMQPVHDNLELLLGLAGADNKKQGRSTQEMFDMDLIHIEPLTYIRGRSIPKQFILVDEAQNLTPHEVKTIITRVGEDTKIVLTGDPFQIDNPYVDSTNNGLVHTVNRFKNEAIAGHITLTRGERSVLAERAAKLL